MLPIARPLGRSAAHRQGGQLGLDQATVPIARQPEAPHGALRIHRVKLVDPLGEQTARPGENTVTTVQTRERDPIGGRGAEHRLGYPE
jgi:hypothetical protein